MRSSFFCNHKQISIEKKLKIFLYLADSLHTDQHQALQQNAYHGWEAV